jgi:hypothetical protein
MSSSATRAWDELNTKGILYQYPHISYLPLHGRGNICRYRSTFNFPFAASYWHAELLTLLQIEKMIVSIVLLSWLRILEDSRDIVMFSWIRKHFLQCECEYWVGTRILKKWINMYSSWTDSRISFGLFQLSLQLSHFCIYKIQFYAHKYVHTYVLYITSLI